MFKKLFCKHKYKTVSLDLEGIWAIYECESCGKLGKGGLPNTNMAVPKMPHSKEKTHHKAHTRQLLRTINEYVCTGCEEKITYETQSGCHQAFRFYGEIIVNMGEDNDT